MRSAYWGKRGKCDVSTKMRDEPDAGVVMKVHVRLATAAQACRDVLANVTGAGGKDAHIVCVNSVSYQSIWISEFKIDYQGEWIAHLQWWVHWRWSILYLGHPHSC